MKGRWFRLYDDLLNDPKVQKLSPKLFKALVNLWCVASKNAGCIPEDETELSFALRTTPKKAKEILFLLFSLGFFEKTTDGMTPHNWLERQHPSDSSTARTRAYRERERHTERHSDALDKRREEKSREDKKDKNEEALRAEFASEFWPSYPHKVGKPDALKAFLSVRKNHSLPEILDGLAAYIAGKPPDRNWLNPATFLRQERFRDRPAPPVKRGEGKRNLGMEAALRLRQELIDREDQSNVKRLGNFASVAVEAGDGSVVESASRKFG
jgi:hypothetical protein